MRKLALILVVVGVFGGIVLGIHSLISQRTIALSAAATTSASCQADVRPGGGEQAGTTADTLSAAQRDNAAIIMRVGADMSMGPYGQQIAIATAMQESKLQNLKHGDRDSLGLFQQRPSMGWGTPEQVMDPVYASTKFYEGLRGIPGWEQLVLWQAADAVQRSGYPLAYQQWANLAAEVVRQGGGGTVACTGAAGPGSRAVEGAISFALQQVGKPYVWGATGPEAYDCSGLMLRAWGSVDVTLDRVSWQQWTNGDPVPLAEAARGDLLFWSTDGTPDGIHHVAMYLGDGTIVEAQQTGVPVHVRPIRLAPPEGELMPSAIRVRAPAGRS